MWFDYKLSAIVTVIFLFIIFIIVTIRLKFIKDDPLPVFLPSSRQPLPDFETGDCVFVSYRSTRGKLVKIFTGSMWSHMGMIYKQANGRSFVIEAVYYDPQQHGVLKTPLEEWLNFNGRRTLGWLRKRGPKIPDSEMDRVFQLVQHCDMDTLVLNWLKAVVNRKYFPEKKSKFYCSELIATLCQELKIMDKVLMPASYSPKTFMELRLPLINGHWFEPPMIFKVNP